MLMDQPQAELGLDFKIVEQIGKGAFAVVYKVKYRDNNDYYAMKTVDKTSIMQNNMSYMIDMTRDEIKLLHKFSRISDKNIINLHCELETQNYIFMVLEYCQFNLREFIEKYNGLPENVILNLFRQIVSGLNLLHKEHIVHRDIKLENIMIKSTQIQIDALNRQHLTPEQFLMGSQLKLIDLGVSKSLGSSQDLTGSHAGSNETMAPEIRDEQLYGLKVDIYSVGAVLFELLTGLKYKQCKDTNKVLKSFSDNTKTVLQHTLAIDQNQRWRPKEILDFLGSPPKLKLVKPKLDPLCFIRKELEDYDIQKKIGEVSLSNVYMGIHIATKQQVFIKILNLTEIKDPTKAKDSAKVKEMVQQEIAILKQYKSPYLTKLVGSKITEQFIFTILEYQYSDLELETLIKGSYPQGMPPELATAILTQIAIGLRILHRQQIVHRELNANHIRLKKFDASNPKKIQVQIAEFGSSKKGKAYTLVGTEVYRAPEVGEYEYDTKADIFSLGAIFMLMLTGEPGNMLIPNRNFSVKEYNLLKSMLQFGPNYRPTLDELLDNLGYKPKIKLIEEPEKRISVVVDGTNNIITKQEQEKTDENNEVDDLKQEYLEEIILQDPGQQLPTFHNDFASAYNQEQNDSQPYHNSKSDKQSFQEEIKEQPVTPATPQHQGTDQKNEQQDFGTLNSDENQSLLVQDLKEEQKVQENVLKQNQVQYLEIETKAVKPPYQNLDGDHKNDQQRSFIKTLEKKEESKMQDYVKIHPCQPQENGVELVQEKSYYSFGVDKVVESKVNKFLIEMKDERNQQNPELLIMVHLYLLCSLAILSCPQEKVLRNYQNSIYNLIYSRRNNKGTWNTQIKINDYVEESKNCCTPWHRFVKLFSSQQQLDKVPFERQENLLKQVKNKELGTLLFSCIQQAVSHPYELKGYLEIQNRYLM